jgi:phosphoglycolate phosphatase-like HAD superfamily hydrolase
MQDKRLIIFDLDGTLVNAYPAIAESFNYAMKETGYRPQKINVIRKSVGWGDRNLLKPFVAKKDLDKVLSIYRKHHKQALLSGSRVFPRAYRVMGYLKNRGYKLAVASNRPTCFVKILIRHLKLDKYLDYVLCADKLRHMKPHPEILNKIMRRFRVKPDRTIFVGDMFIDAQTGRRAKVKTVMLTTGSSTREELAREKPYRIIGRLSDLMKLV